MTVATCPSCHENVTVPVDALPESTVRCPLCQEEFQLAEFLAQLPPSLIVLNGTPAADESTDETPVFAGLASSVFEGSATSGFAAPAQEEATAVDDGVPAFQLDVEAEGNRGSDVQIESAPRRQRQQKNAGWEVAKIVGGAVLALPVAQLILWWLPGSWKRDPLNLGPSVGRVAPWIVPSDYRPDSGASAARDAARPRYKAKTQATRRRATKPRHEESTTIPRPGATESQAATNAPENPPELPPAASGSETQKRKPRKRPARRAPPKLAGPSGGEPGPAHAPPPPEYSIDDLRNALEAAFQASVAWDTTLDESEKTRSRLTDEFYTAFARLGETVTFIKPGDPAARQFVESMHDLLTAFEQQPKKLAMIGNRTSDWLDQDARSSRGVLLFGTVKQIRLQGRVFETELELASRKKRIVPIISKIDPRPFYSANDRILMLGAIVNQPANSVTGYEGGASVAVLGSFPVPLKR